jgi:hypothetical protein
MATPEEDEARRRMRAAEVALCALLGALEKVRDLIASGDVAGARAHAETALRDADEYLELVEDEDSL